MNYKEAKQLATRIQADGLEGKHPLYDIGIRQFDLSGNSYGKGAHTVQVHVAELNAPVIFSSEAEYEAALFEAMQVERIIGYEDTE